MQSTYRVADDTFVIPSSVRVPGLGYAYLSPMIIRGTEPTLVDTGSPVHRAEYLEAAFSIVEPHDVRWIFLSHDDRDHAGNIMQVLEACPNATLVTNFVAVARMSEEWQLPMHRMRWVNDGESFQAGDRTLVALRPPLFDSPATRGLWDAKTEVYYSVDCFGALVPSLCEELGDVPREAWAQGFAFFNRINHPWHEYVDPAKFDRLVERIRRLDPKVIVTYHGPHAKNRTEECLRMIGEIARMEPLVHPSQSDLEAMLSSAPAR
jgi:flavorubredoxin